MKNNTKSERYLWVIEESLDTNKTWSSLGGCAFKSEVFSREYVRERARKIELSGKDVFGVQYKTRVIKYIPV